MPDGGRARSGHGIRVEETHESNGRIVSILLPDFPFSVLMLMCCCSDYGAEYPKPFECPYTPSTFIVTIVRCDPRDYHHWRSVNTCSRFHTILAAVNLPFPLVVLFQYSSALRSSCMAYTCAPASQCSLCCYMALPSTRKGKGDGALLSPQQPSRQQRIFVSWRSPICAD